MPHPRDHDSTRLQALMTVEPRVEYLVLRREDVWFIEYDGEEYGPYKSSREAMLFAIDAAYKLGEHGTETQVRMKEPDGVALAAWTYGVDPFPPRY